MELLQKENILLGINEGEVCFFLNNDHDQRFKFKTCFMKRYWLAHPWPKDLFSLLISLHNVLRYAA